MTDTPHDSVIAARMEEWATAYRKSNGLPDDAPLVFRPPGWGDFDPSIPYDEAAPLMQAWEKEQRATPKSGRSAVLRAERTARWEEERRLRDREDWWLIVLQAVGAALGIAASAVIFFTVPIADGGVLFATPIALGLSGMLAGMMSHGWVWRAVLRRDARKRQATS